MSLTKLPSAARAVVVGGGIGGLNAAYHLAAIGWKDVILLEQSKLTSGTTWHAAGLLGVLGGTRTEVRMRHYGLDFYRRIARECEEEDSPGAPAGDGSNLGIHNSGGLYVTSNPDRWDKAQRSVDMVNAIGGIANYLTPEEIADYHPYVNPDGLLGAVYTPDEAYANPVDLTNGVARAAKKLGVKIIEGARVSRINVVNENVRTLEVTMKDETTIVDCENVVLCGGMWTQQLAATVGVSVPLYPCEHSYVLTPPIADMPRNIPTVRAPDDHMYVKEDAGKLLLGLFETNPKIAFANTKKVPDNFSFGQFPDDMEHVTDNVLAALNRFPILEDYGIATYFNGPESFTPDGEVAVGQTEISNLYVCAGFNSKGIATAPATAKLLADMMNSNGNGFTKEIHDVDVLRFPSWWKNINFVTQRATETLARNYRLNMPHEQNASVRDVIMLPYHDRYVDMGAVPAPARGLERPKYFDKELQRNPFYSMRRQPWYEAVARECHSVRSNVGLLELSGFTKIRYDGPRKHLQYLCTNTLPSKPGSACYTLMLNDGGGIEGDMTVTLLPGTPGQDRFMITSGTATHRRDMHWISKQLRRTAKGHDYVISDVTDDQICLGVMGPNAKKLMSLLLNDKNDHLQRLDFGCSTYIHVGGVPVLVQRLSYVGSLGYELFAATNDSVELFRAIMTAGEGLEMGISCVGSIAVDVLRIEKGNVHFPADVGPDVQPKEAGMMFAVNNNHDFIGKDNLRNVISTRLIHAVIPDWKLDDQYVHGNEPLFIGDRSVGQLTSAAYSPTYKKQLVMAHLQVDDVGDDAGNINVALAGEMYPLSILTQPIHFAAGNKEMRM